MDERSSTSNSKERPRRGGRRVSFPAAAIAATAAILFAEILIAENRAAFLDDVYPITASKLDWIKHGKENPDVLIFGDSRYFNIDPALVSESLGGASTKNVSWPAYGIDGFHLTLETYLSNHEPPEIIITHLPPDALSMKSEVMLLGQDQFSLDRAFFMVPGRQIIRLFASEGKWNLVWQAIEFQLNPPSVKYRRGIIGAARMLVTGGNWRPANQELWYEQYDETEAFVLFEEQTVPPELLGVFAKFYDPFELYAEPAVLARYEQFLDMTRDRGIAVVLLNTPMPEMIAYHYEERGILTGYRDYIEELAAKYPNLLVLDPVTEVYPDTELADFGHVNRAGDARFREDYAARLAAAAERIRELAGKL